MSHVLSVTFTVLHFDSPSQDARKDTDAVPRSSWNEQWRCVIWTAGVLLLNSKKRFGFIDSNRSTIEPFYKSHTKKYNKIQWKWGKHQSEHRVSYNTQHACDIQIDVCSQSGASCARWGHHTIMNSVGCFPHSFASSQRLTGSDIRGRTDGITDKGHGSALRIQKIPLAIFRPFCFIRGSVELDTCLLRPALGKPLFFRTKS